MMPGCSIHVLEVLGVQPTILGIITPNSFEQLLRRYRLDV